MNRYLIALSFIMMGCEPNENKAANSKFDTAQPKLLKTGVSYAIVTQGMHRDRDSIYYTSLPNPSENAIENIRGGYDEYLLCGYDFILHKSDEHYKAKLIAQINTSCGHMLINDKTYYNGIENFYSLMKGAYRGIQRIDSSIYPVREIDWLSKKMLDTNFIAYSARNECEIFEYKFKLKYRWSDKRTIKAFLPEIQNYSWAWPLYGDSQIKYAESMRVCGEHYFWTDSVDICMKSNYEFSYLLDSLRINHDSSSYKKVYDAYYKTKGRITGIESLDSMQRNKPLPKQNSILKKLTLPKTQIDW